MSWSEQIQMQFPAFNKNLLDYIERAISCTRRWNLNAEEQELAIARIYDGTKESIEMAHKYVQQRLPSYLPVERMSLFLSLSIADHDYRIRALDIFRAFSDAVSIFFSERQDHIVVGQVWRQTFGMHVRRNYFRRMIDAAKDIIWFMYYDCDEDSRLCGIWCGQSYLNACGTIGYDVSHLSETNLPVISWSCCYCGSVPTTLEDVNLNRFIEQGAIPKGFYRQLIVEDLEGLFDVDNESPINPFTVLNLTIDPDLLNKNLSSDELHQRIETSRKNRLLAQYGEDGLKFLSSALQSYVKSVQTTISKQQGEDRANDDETN